MTQWMLAVLAALAILFYAGFLWKLFAESHLERPRHATLGRIVDAGFIFPTSRNEIGWRLRQPVGSTVRWLPCSDPLCPFCGEVAKQGQGRRIAVR